MARVLERQGSRTYGGGTGRILFYVIECASEDEAEEAALDDPLAVESINGYLREDVSVDDLGGGLYTVDLTYRRGVPQHAQPTAGETPASARPAPAGTNPNDELSRSVNVTSGGGMQRIYQARQVRHAVARPETDPPDFFGLIGYNAQTGEIQGTEVHSATTDFVITKQLPSVTLAFYRHAMDLSCALNSMPYLGCDVEEVLFLGLDLQSAGDDKPWTATGRFKYSRNRVNVPIDAFDPETADLVLLEVCGHDWVDVHYERAEEIYLINGQDVGVMVQRPKYAYALRVYPLDSEITEEGTASLDDLGLN